MPPVPDIVIEVIWTSGGLDKLAIYRGLGVPEVWFWQEGGLSFYLLDEGGYTVGARSTRLPDLDPELLTRCMAEPSTQTAAVRAYRQALRAVRAGRCLKSDGGESRAPCASSASGSQSAKVATFGERVEDIFDITDAQDRTVEDPVSSSACGIPSPPRWHSRDERRTVVAAGLCSG